jgi:hypothetical protein
MDAELLVALDTLCTCMAPTVDDFGDYDLDYIAVADCELDVGDDDRD